MYENKLRYLIGAGALMSLLCGCSDPGETGPGLEPETRSNVSLRLPAAADAASSPIWDHTKIYLFNTNDTFKSQVTNIRRTGNNLKMEIPEGTWELVMAGAEQSVDLIAPVFDKTWGQMKMWETQASGGVLPSMPELRTAKIPQVTIRPDQNTNLTDPVQYIRNVAKVQVLITEAAGLQIGGGHNIELTNVPTTLAWDGSLFPSRTAPTVSSSPLKGTLTVSDNPQKPGFQKSTEAEFIIPAHKPTSQTDTTTCKLKLTVRFPYAGGSGAFEKREVEIPRVPRANEILRVQLKIAGNLEIISSILEWKDVNIDADLSTTQLYTSKPRVELAYKDTVFVQTNAPTWTVAKDNSASWLTVTQTADKKAVIVTTERESYPNSPRESYFTIKANNVVKKVPVRQRPDEGTLSVDRTKIVLCPKAHVRGSVNVTSIGGDWEIVGTPQKATPDRRTGNKGATRVTFTRNTTDNSDLYDTTYGDETVTIRNKMSLETKTVQIVNCFIDIPDNRTIDASMPTGSDKTKETVTNEITVYGGSKDINVTSPTDWIYDFRWSPNNQQLRFITKRAPDDEPRDGEIKIQHKECTDYTVDVKVHQDMVITIPQFDYFVVKFTWTNDDVDTAVAFEDNGMPYDDWAVGFYVPNSSGGASSTRLVQYKGKDLLQWGGDATMGQGETSFFNATTLENDQDSPRKVKLRIYATWYTAHRAPDRMTFSTTAYKGGIMEQRGTNFYNVGGTQLYTDSKTVMITTKYGAPDYKTKYTKVATLEYDRKKHTAKITVHAGEVRSADAPTRAALTPEQEAQAAREAAEKPVFPYKTVNVE